MTSWYRASLWGGVLLAIGGCAVPAQDVCEDFRSAANAAYARCGLDSQLLPEAWLTWVEGPCAGMTTSCAYISAIENANEVLNGCIPFYEDESCEIITARPGGPEYCNRQFQGPSSDRLTCRPVE